MLLASLSATYWRLLVIYLKITYPSSQAKWITFEANLSSLQSVLKHNLLWFDLSEHRCNDLQTKSWDKSSWTVMMAWYYQTKYRLYISQQSVILTTHRNLPWPEKRRCRSMGDKVKILSLVESHKPNFSVKRNLIECICRHFAIDYRVVVNSLPIYQRRKSVVGLESVIDVRASCSCLLMSSSRGKEISSPIREKSLWINWVWTSTKMSI
jgi:hypothetical protein